MTSPGQYANFGYRRYPIDLGWGVRVTVDERFQATVGDKLESLKLQKVLLDANVEGRAFTRRCMGRLGGWEWFIETDHLWVAMVVGGVVQVCLLRPAAKLLKKVLERTDPDALDSLARLGAIGEIVDIVREVRDERR